MHHALNRENFKPHHTLPFYKIHASHVNFWASSCIPCKPSANLLYSSYIRMDYDSRIPCHKINGYNDQCLSHALFNHIQETLWMGRGDVEE